MDERRGRGQWRDGTGRGRTAPEGAARSGPHLGVVGACGGAGASVLAAALARVAARADDRALLVDGDARGGGLDVLLGIEDDPGLRWPDLHAARGEVSAEDVVPLLPAWHGVRVLSADRTRPWALTPDVPTDVLRALQRTGDVVVHDLRAPDLAAWADRCTAVVVVARCDLTSVAGAVALRDALGATPAGLVVRGPAPGRLGAHDVADATGLPLWGEVRRDRALPGAVERGEGPPVRARRGAGGDLRRTAVALLTHARAFAARAPVAP
ncbi:septum site-determining protein Ssd [Sanguibacter suaedae]|uniref:Pilus assembly protein FlpE n=1 Tax=Sanguibacter suaedae TaxID=2795737 RepID=A0A934ICR7_9MICO|nr:septum site-determining protein Ssd [Sanguibacter suaedae]MBI9115972.1 pilus assembly protein FlpE [Sanguibacter suaedae]